MYAHICVGILGDGGMNKISQASMYKDAPH